MTALAKRQPGASLPPEVEAEIIRQYESGAQRQEIIDKTGVGRSTVSDVLNRNGVQLRSQRVCRQPEREAEVVQLYRAGTERRIITEKTGVPNSTITWILKRAGIDLTHKRRAGVPSARAQAVRKLYLEGKSNSEIAATLNITTGTVAGIIYRSGVRRDEALNVANVRRAALVRSPRPKAAPKLKLVAVASHDDTRVLMVPEEEAAKFAAREAAPQIITAGEDPVLKLRALDCRWPIGKVRSPSFRFCCQPRCGPGFYCTEHDRASRSKATVPDKDLIRNLRRYA